ncbi:MAG: hypothetical protein A2142_00365 [candidate division Zixibacteria bacterium RBG_16_48_11]|nr:MAG: hypothetical protein A2142_00365 [candidate division Zixibacteria bacterium RBG_16_48_11]
MSYLRWEKEFLFQYLVAALLLFLSLLGFLLTLRQTLKSFYDFPPWLADLSPIFAVLALPLFFKYYTYLYDFPNLFLFTLGFLLIVTQRTFPFYLIFILAAFNKETSLILIALYLVRNYERLPRKTLIAQLLSLGLIWAVIMAILKIAYSDNPGSWLEFHLLNHNLRLISDPWTLAYLFAFSTGWWLLVSHHWVSKSIFLRHGLLITLLPLVILAALFGNLDELRMYYEALPFLFLLSMHTIAELYGINLALKYQN